jgi:protein-disulfide isomerase
MPSPVDVDATEDQPRRRPRLVGLIAVAVALGILGFAIVSISVGTGTEGQIQITGAEETQSLIGGLQQDGPRLGNPDAPVTIQVFNDLQCDPCSDWHRQVVEPLIGGPVRGGHAQMIWHNFPMSESGYGLASYAAVAAAKQDYEWQFVNLFFLNQDKIKTTGVTNELLDNLGRAILNFNVEQWQHDRGDRSAIEPALQDDDKLAADRQFPAEPAVVVGGPNGSKQLDQSPSLAEIQAAIAQVG